MNHSFKWALVLGAFVATANMAQADQCEVAVGAFNTSLTSANLGQANADLKAVEESCAGAEHTSVARCSKRLFSYYLFNAAETEDDLKKALQNGPLWQIHEALGDAATSRSEEGEAAQHYQNAINALAEPIVCNNEDYDKSPEGMKEQGEIISRVRNKASRAMLLAKDFVAPPPDKEGKLGGIFTPSVRDFAIEEVPIPIQFIYKQAAVTPDKGEAALSSLVLHLLQAKNTQVSLSGHTDGVGSDAYNCKLSAERLATVAKKLQQEIPGITVTSYPTGKYLPFEPDSIRSYSNEEKDAMNRRVVLLENGAVPKRVCP